MRRLLPFCLALLAAACSSGGDDPEGPPPAACGYHDDCGTGEVCFEGACYGTASCLERRNCRNVPVCADDRCFCDEDTNRCLPACVTDDDCPSDGHCLDGICERHPVDFTTWPPPEAGPRGDLQVGLARVLLDFPMGVSMAGYGSRQGPRTPYQDSLGGSHSWFDRPDVRAAVFDDGEEMFVLLRTPTCWSTDFMLARTAEKVAERTGVNLLDRIVQTAPHSHSHPARYWHLVNGLGFGFFGYGEFSFEIFERMTDSFADAVELALMDRQPARFGYTVLEDFDPDDRIHRDRRDRNDNLPGYIDKDRRMLLMRVDDLDGHPLAVFSHFGIHGTVFGGDNPYLTGDAGGGVEVELTRLASAKYGREVMGFFIQGNAGDVSPAGDDRQHNDFERLQVLGRRAWAALEPVLDGIETTADVDVSLFTGRVPISHAHLGYDDGAFFDSDVSCEATPDYFRYGAFQCVEGTYDDRDPATAFTDGDLNCVFSLECLTGGYPVPQFQKTVLTVARLGPLALGTMPGEPVSQFGRDASDRMLEVMDEVTDAAIVGYSQDHHFYLLNEDDWLQGGYEPSRDIWGWRLGPYLIDRLVDVAREAAKPPQDRSFDPGNLKPVYWTGTEEELRRVPLTASEAPDAVVEDVPARVERLTEVAFAWQGGHPGLDQPQVTLHRVAGDVAEPVTLPGGLPYDDRGFRMIVTYEGDCDRSQCEDHQWRVRWQEGRDFAAGTYRFHVEGEAYDGREAVAYAVDSRDFEVAPSTNLQISEVGLGADALTGVVLDPPQVVRDGDQAKDAAFFLQSLEVPGRLGAPLPADRPVDARARLTRSGETPLDLVGGATLEVVPRLRRRLVGWDEAGAPRYADDRERPTSVFTFTDPRLAALDPGDYRLELELTDPAGNRGTFTATVTR